MSSTTTPQDPYRADAALVYRAMRDSAVPMSAVDLAWQLFPWPTEGPPSSIKVIRKRSIRRVFDSIVWMRHNGAMTTAIPMIDGTTVFRLGVHPVSITPFVREKPEFAMPVSSTEEEKVVTAKVSQPTESSVGGEAMDVWHGK